MRPKCLDFLQYIEAMSSH
jgi:hypothetical protein